MTWLPVAIDLVALDLARRARPEALRVVARSLGSESVQLAEAIMLLEAAAPQGWTGPAADGALASRSALVRVLRVAEAGVLESRTALQYAARELGAAADLLRHADSVAGSAGGRVDVVGRFVAPATALPADPALLSAAVREQARTAAEVEALTARAASSARAADETLGRALVSGAWEASCVLAVPHADAATAGAPEPDDGALPYAASAWWRGLSHEQRRRVLRDRPEAVGPLDGIPSAARHEANLALLARAQERADRARAAVEGGASARPDALLGAGLQGRAVGHVERRRVAELAALRAVLEQGDGVPRRLLLLDDSGPYVRAVVTVGDPDTAAHVATYVGGLSTSVGGDVARYDRLLGGSRLAAAGPGVGEDLAVVTWMGYVAPQVVEILDPGGRSVLGEALAVQAAPALARFLVGVDAARDDDPHLTLWAHSYGTVVAGHALRLNTGTDDVVLFGSPGVAVDSLAAAGLKPGSLNVLRAPYDLVAHTGWHRRDPTDIPGVTLLATGAALAPDGRMLTRSSGHSAYLTPGSTSAWNLLAVAVGRRDLAVLAETVR